MSSPTPAAARMRAELTRQLPQVVEVLGRYGATNLRMFGSVARGDAREDSDLDLLVDLQPDRGNGLLRVAGLTEELSDLLGLKVDVAAATLLSERARSTASADATDV